MRLHAAELGLGGVEHDRVDPEVGEELDEVGAGLGDKFVGEEVPVAKDDPNASEGWVIINHEMTQKNDRIGDGGGMTMFKLRRLPNDQLEISNQTLADGRSGKFFNVDFANTVGETGMNCGGINGGNRIWTAEEWMQSSNLSVSNFL